jgi:signal transduction histidine kinase
MRITAPEVGVDGDFAMMFGLSSRVAQNGAYRSFLEQFTLLAASARHQLESQARQRIVEAERDRLLLDAPVGAAVMIGPDLVYHLVNEVYAAVSGRPAADMVGKSFTGVFPELAGSPVHKSFLDVYEAGEPFVGPPTLVQIHRHGGVLDDRYFTYNLSPLRTLAGDVYGLMVIAVDITVQVESRAEVEHLNVELRSAARAKDEFLALLGHELRNPLAPIVSALDLMRMRDRSAEREQVIIRRQVTHLTRLVDDLLDISRITRGIVELRKETFDVVDVLGDAANMVAPLIAQRQQRLDTDIVSVSWHGDPARLAQIVSNLLTNASRYSPDGAVIALNARVTGTELVIDVTDRGIGIAPDKLSRIFEPFFQGTRKMHDAVGGLGIGLALVKSFCELHGGHVEVFSAGLGEGSTFTVHLPFTAGPAAMVDTRQNKQVEGADRPKNILVVDDNIDAADSLAEIVRLFGHRVHIAYTPESALDVFQNQPIDLALLDIGLPNITGHELAGMMRETGANPLVRFVALSGFGQSADKAQSASAGFERHLVKPLAIEDLHALFDS